MRTLEGTAATVALRRDLWLLARMAAMLFQYFTVGGQIRRRYRTAEARGEVYWVDAGGPTLHREQGLRRR